MNRRSRRILFVIGSLTPGGAERVISMLSNEFVRSDTDVAILTVDPGQDAFELDPRVIRIRADTTVPGRSIMAAILRFVRTRRQIRRAVAEYRPTCIFSFLNTLNVRVLDALRGVSVPIFISERNTKDSLSSVGWRLLRQRTYPRATGLVVQTQRQADAFAGYNRDITIIPNPLDIPSPRPRNKKERIILLVGRMSPQKQFDRFLEEVRNTDLKGYKIVIAGERREPMDSAIATIINDDQYPHEVEVVGHVSDTASLYDAAEVFVLPSRHEGFPNALSEALAWGCSVVSFDCPTGPAELIDDQKNGLLVPDQDWDGLREALQTVLSDHTLRDRFYAAAIEGQKKYALPLIARRWLSLCTPPEDRS
jgi:GalNAc-alpha-(1->4)-GalNAc-alpha-(1->3)-diNAcBac-PP-undecaprenol alpha-1,4-N-acetyl-D-galactosaminyltransferase